MEFIAQYRLDQVFLWIAFASLSGVYDGLFYSLRDHNLKWKIHPHIIASIIRLIAALMIASSMEFEFWHYVKDLFGLGLMFSFWQDGFYYTSRGKWFDKVPGYNFATSHPVISTSFSIKMQGNKYQPFEIPFFMRCLFFIFGFIVFTDITQSLWK